jgi:hypothetical protein
MKKSLPALFLMSVLMTEFVNAQWCTPTTAIPYNANMPGITHVAINTIDRTSTDLENYPSNSYVNTGLSTQLIKGVTYDISLSYTIDASICPDMNLRVWIDFNQDGQLDDVGETVISANNQLPPTYIGSFTVPPTATPGNTRMRITAKMSPSGGHTLPTPCDVPADPLGYHGEIEDYDVEIIEPTNIADVSQGAFLSVKTSPEKINFSFSLDESKMTSLQLLDMQGRIVEEFLNQQELSAGDYTFDCAIKTGGIYFAVLVAGENKKVTRVFVQ